MTGKEVIDLGLKNIYRSFFEYRKGKKPSIDLDNFQYNLEHELFALWQDLNIDSYKHRGYRKFTICDNKKREISVASVRDRVVHRLVYDYLTEIYDKIFIYDAWSCRKNKGLVGAIERTQIFMKQYSDGFIWRADISKFFDGVDHDVLLEILKLRITNKKIISLLKEIITSFNTKEGKGMPIGNLTSQIFSNIYLNEFDRYIKHSLKCKAYVRYGDDFVIFDKSKENLVYIREKAVCFLTDKIKLIMHAKNDFIITTKQGLKFLGVQMFPKGRKLSKRNSGRIIRKLELKNVASYSGIIRKHSNEQAIKKFQWMLISDL
ncbi:group II intron reverse transcriptase domain-containing protein [Candidatus Peregrinibacteria bacterium]|nr:group II intron reverse transcriptase domain-containing protein [Candidatus Peregrinibacteria bacterium]